MIGYTHEHDDVTESSHDSLVQDGSELVELLCKYVVVGCYYCCAACLLLPHCSCPFLTSSLTMSCVCRGFRLVGGDEIVRLWAEEAMQWAIHYKEFSVSIVSLQIHRHVLSVCYLNKSILLCFFRQ